MEGRILRVMSQRDLVEEISKQNIEGAVYLLLTTYSKMKEGRNYLKTEFII